jgi:hypothetical protein
MITRYDPGYEQYERAHLALFAGAAIVLLVCAWTFGAFIN